MLDKDKTNIGTVSSTFTDANGNTFNYSERIEATSASLSAFIAAAVAARNTWATRVTTEATYVTDVKAGFTSSGETNA